MKSWIRRSLGALLLAVALTGCASGGGTGGRSCVCKSDCACAHCSSLGKDACPCGPVKK